MPFLGNQPSVGYSSIVKDDFTGNGSDTAFTLSKSVASANDIAVFVGNVRQEPTDAYTVNGTTLTMSAPPSSSDNFYVLHLASAITSSTVPATGTITSGMLTSGSVTSAKLDTNIAVAGNLTVDTNTLYVDATNNKVGIGNSIPNSFYSEAKNLVIGTGTGGQGTTIYSGSASQGRIMFADGTSGSDAYTGFVQYDHSSNAMQFGTNGGTERMRIDSSGNVGIGTSSPSVNLDIQRNASSDVSLQLYNTNSSVAYASVLKLNAANATGSRYNAITSNNGATAQWRISGGGSDSTLAFATGSSNTERLRILSSGGITFNGDTAAANALDDYEEGTWTPSVGNDATYFSRGGVYRKIGRLVWIGGYIRINQINSGLTNRIQGLPFSASTGGSTGEFTIAVDKADNLSASVTWLALRTSGTELYATYRTAASTSGTVNGSFLTTNTEVQFAGCYST